MRALLLVLLARGGGTREELAGALWPDLDTAGALRNLRVTLSYLLAVLEPDRPDGAPSFFVRAEGPSLRLVTDGWLEVDACAVRRPASTGPSRPSATASRRPPSTCTAGRCGSTGGRTSPTPGTRSGRCPTATGWRPGSWPPPCGRAS